MGFERQLHKIVTLDDAYRQKVGHLSQVINGSLLGKRDQLLAQIYRINYRAEEIKHVKTVIERDARAEYGGIIERLRSAEGKKVAVLQHEMGEIQRDVDRIAEILQTFSELTREDADPVNFMLRSRVINENIEYMLAKPFKVMIDVYPYDLPRELAELRKSLERHKVLEEILKFKDEVIWKLYEEKRQAERKAVEELDKAAQEEMNEWAKLTDKFADELKKFQMVCFFCAQMMDDKNVNKKCKANVNKALPVGCKPFQFCRQEAVIGKK